MLVEEVMTHGIETIDARASVSQAAALMKKRGIGLLVVLNGKKASGVITDRDIVVRSVSLTFSLMATEVHKVMTNNLIWCRQDFSIESAAELMEKNKISWLLVVDQDYQPVGIVSVEDLAIKPRESGIAGKELSQIRRNTKRFPISTTG